MVLTGWWSDAVQPTKVDSGRSAGSDAGPAAGDPDDDAPGGAPLQLSPRPNREDASGADGLEYLQVKARLRVNMTPVRQTHEAQRIEDTPVGAAKDVYKFYCPLCMFYLKGSSSACRCPAAPNCMLTVVRAEIHQSSCCGHYTCGACAVQYLRGTAVLLGVRRPWSVN